MRKAKMVFLFSFALPASEHSESAVERPCRTAEIKRVRWRCALSVFESHCRRKRFRVYGKETTFRLNRRFIAVYCILKLRICKISAIRKLCALVGETALFDTQRPFGQHAYTHVADDDRILFFARSKFLRKPHFFLRRTF